MLLTSILALAAIALVAALVVVFRKVDKLPLPRVDTERVRHGRGAGNGLSLDDLEDLPPIGGANQARMAAKQRQITRTGTVYTPPVATATESPTDMSNVILLASIINAEASEPVASTSHVEHHTPGHAADPCHSTDTSTSNHVDTSHCHTDSGSGFDGGGHGGHH